MYIFLLILKNLAKNYNQKMKLKANGSKTINNQTHNINVYKNTKVKN